MAAREAGLIRPSRNLRVARLLGPQSADRCVMHSKRPGNIRQRFPRLSSCNRFALLMSVKLERSSHMDASGFGANATLASPYTD